MGVFGLFCGVFLWFFGVFFLVGGRLGGRLFLTFFLFQDRLLKFFSKPKIFMEIVSIKGK